MALFCVLIVSSLIFYMQPHLHMYKSFQIFVNPFRSGFCQSVPIRVYQSIPIRVLSIRSDPGFVNPFRSGFCQSVPIRSDPGFVDAAKFAYKDGARSKRPKVKTAPLRWAQAWAYGKEKIRGAERNLPDFFGLSKKALSKKFSGGGRSDSKKFLLDSVFPTKLTEFPTKLTGFVPFIFILPDCEANIARLALLAQQIGGGGCRPLRPPPPRPVRPWA